MEAALEARIDSLKGPGKVEVVAAEKESTAATSQRISRVA